MQVFYKIGDKVRLKKPHPCGSYIWEVMRVGADFRIKCEQCQHTIWISRTNFEKSVKEVLAEHDDTDSDTKL